jgi:uncharacterized protein (TIGR01370 family)
MEVCLFLGLISFLSGQNEAAGGTGVVQRFAVYYTDEAPMSEFDNFDLLVFDSDYHPALNTLADRGKTLLGYISLGEVEDNRAYYDDVKKEGILLQENRYWKGSYFVDLRDSRWTRRVIERLIPRILGRGFQGLFLDTLDNAAHLEQINPSKFKGMQSAAADLVKTIRYHYPSIQIMLNRAYEILPAVGEDIDMVLGESVFADYNFETKSYHRVPPKLYRQQVEILSNARRQSPTLQIMTLDYWDPGDRDGLLEIYSEQRKNGFVPYVATVELDRVVPEPRP